MKNKIIFLGISLLIAFSSCKKEEDLSKPVTGLEGDSWVKGPLDEWIYDNFTKPYNISVDYRWNGSELGLNSTLVPTKEDRVIPLMTVVKEAWIDVYAKAAGEEFIKKLSPRQYMLVGSPRYNASGTITVGSASAGSKVVIYRTNWFTVEDRAIVKRVLKTIHHEFAHILHQNVMYPEEYELISPADYTSSWNSISSIDANNAGFITPYAMADVNEDFAEMIGILLTEGREGYQEILDEITNPEALEKIKQKEEIIVNYLDQVWGFDFYNLQQLTEEAINKISPLPSPDPLHSLIGTGNSYESMEINFDDQDNLSPNYLAALNEVNGKMESWGGRIADSFTFYFDSPTSIRFAMRYENPSSGKFFWAYYDFEVSMNEAGDISFISWDHNATNSNGATAESRIKPMLDYLLNHTFNLAWHGDPRETDEKYGAFYEVNTPTNYFYGTLQ